MKPNPVILAALPVAAAGFGAGVWLAGGEGGPERPGSAEPEAASEHISSSAARPPPAASTAAMREVGTAAAVPALAAWLESADGAQIAALADEMLPGTVVGLRRYGETDPFPRTWRRVLFFAWIEADAAAARAGASAAFQNVAGPLHVRRALRDDFLIALAWHDPRGAIELVRAEAPESLFAVARQVGQLAPEVLLELAASDPELKAALGSRLWSVAAMEIARGGEENEWIGRLAASAEEKQELAAMVARHLATSDPEQAVEWASRLEGAARGAAFLHIARMLERSGRIDDAFLQAIRESPPSSERGACVISAAARLAREDPAAARRWANAHFSGPELDEVKIAILGVEAAKDYRVVFDFAEAAGWRTDLEFATNRLEGRGSGGSRHGVTQPDLQTLLENAVRDAVAAEGPEAALARVADIPDPRASGQAMQAVAAKWAESDPAAAAHAIIDLQEAPGGSRAVAAVMQEWVQLDPDKALAFAASDPAVPEGLRRMMLGSCITALTEIDPAGVIERLAELPAKVQSEAASTFVNATASHQPMLAAEALAALPPGAGADQNWRHVAENMVNVDPAAAAAWAASAPAGEPARDVYEGMAEQWTEFSPADASAWVGSLAAGPAREAALTGLVAGMLRDPGRPEYEAALAWANTAADPAARESLLRHVIRRWRTNDSEAAASAAAKLEIEVE